MRPRTGCRTPASPPGNGPLRLVIAFRPTLADQEHNTDEEDHALDVGELETAEHWFAEGRERQPEVFRVDPAVPHHMGLPPALAWDYPNLLTWLRTLEERIERRGRSGGPKLGLLPPIAEPELREEVTKLFNQFKARVGGERELTNYALHASRIPQGSPRGRLREDGTVTMAIPDPSADPIYIFEQFRYDEGRDLRTFATAALAATEAFIDGLLNAFEKANDRVRARREASKSPAS